MSENISSDTPLEVSDASLLRLYARTRSEDAFAQLVQRYMHLVHSTAVRCVCGDSHLAQDICQHVFIQVARRAEALAEHRALEGWLYTTTRYEACHFVRREQRRRLREKKADLMNGLSDGPEPETNWGQIRPLLDSAMGTLSHEDREAVVMRFFLKRSFRDISIKLGRTEDAARMRVDRALQKLNRALSRRGVTSTAGAVAGLLSSHAVVAAPAGLAQVVTAAALTSMGGVGGMTFTLLHLMTTTKFATGIGVALVALAVGTSVREISAHARIEASLAATNQEIDSRRRHFNELEERLKAATNERVQMQRAAEVSQAAAVPKISAPVPSRPSVRVPRNKTPDVVAGDRFLADHPEAKKLWDDRERAMILTNAGPLFRAVGLTPAEMAQVQDLLLQAMTRNTSVNGPDGLITLHADPTVAREELETRLAKVVGPDRAARMMGPEMEELRKQGPVYDLVAQLAGAVYRSEPLTSAQIDRVAKIVATSRSSRDSGSAVDPASIDWSMVLAEARTVLSTTQLAALADLQRRKSYQQVLQSLGAADRAAATGQTP
jgi:RNA polymerase sigma factor (sigma-70 family)